MKKRTERRKRGGFTIVEVIVVASLIAVVALVIGPALTRNSRSVDASVPGANFQPGPNLQGKYEIDSVPRGAVVKLLPPKGATNQEARVMGKTPLTLNRAECNNARILVEMEMADYLKVIEPLPELKNWIERFNSDRFFSAGSYTPTTQAYFSFDTSQSEQSQSMDGGLVSIGPVYNFAEMVPHSRICALFIPRGIKREAFFPLMPSPGNYPPLEGKWPEQLRNKYQLTEAQARCAMECMTRCGKFEVTVPDPYKSEKGQELDFTSQLDGTISIMHQTLSILIPGLDDKP